MKEYFLLLAIVQASFGAIARPVHIDSGTIEGIPSAIAGVTAFRGIPYAAAPIGKLRWASPGPVPAWSSVQKADRFKPACPQNNMEPGSTAFFGDYEAKSEDCLYLNVWTPSQAAGDKLPVMVWIHGGGFRSGSGTESLHHGEHLAAKGVVLVTFNYRLGVFGFLAHPELTRESGYNASGNYGLMDQVAALEWVKRNIAAFGGDPNRVMIFGESAGSASVTYMQATPLAKGLFHAAGGESGGPFSGRNVVQLRAAEETGVKFAKAVGAQSLADLRAKQTDELIAVSVRTTSQPVAVDPSATNTRAGNPIPSYPVAIYPFAPIVDGYVVPEDVYLIFAKGKQNRVPVLVGSNSDEGATLRMLPPALGDPSEQRQLKAIYPVGSEAKIVSDATLWAARTWASLETKTGETKAYQFYFSHTPPLPTGQQFARDVDVRHSPEIIYIFNNLDVRKAKDWPATEWDRKLADTMSSYWVNFAAKGDPNGEGLPVWPAWSERDTRVIEFGDIVGAVSLPRQAEIDFWDRVNLKAYRK